ncbi:hypothetical protein BDV18DRAFT_162407 [Aspergillus unguis]
MSSPTSNTTTVYHTPPEGSSSGDEFHTLPNTPDMSESDKQAEATDHQNSGVGSSPADPAFDIGAFIRAHLGVKTGTSREAGESPGNANTKAHTPPGLPSENKPLRGEQQVKNQYPAFCLTADRAATKTTAAWDPAWTGEIEEFRKTTGMRQHHSQHSDRKTGPGLNDAEVEAFRKRVRERLALKRNGKGMEDEEMDKIRFS